MTTNEKLCALYRNAPQESREDLQQEIERLKDIIADRDSEIWALERQLEEGQS